MKLIREQLLGQTFQTVYHIFCRVTLFSTLLAQTAIIDYYIIFYHDLFWGWYTWVIADVLVVTLFLTEMILSYRRLRARPVSVRDSRVKKCSGDLPLSYIAWFIYAAVLSTKACILYSLPDSPALKLKEADFFGPNMLKTGVSLSSIIIYMLVLTNHDSKTGSSQNQFIQGMVGSIYLDILDTTQFMGILREESQVIMTFNLHHLAMAIIVFNFIMPAEALFVLSRTHFGKFPYSHKFQLLHKIIYFLISNVPMFVIRMLIWHLHDQNISVFLMKNVMAVGLAIKEIHEFWLEVSDIITEPDDEVKEKGEGDGLAIGSESGDKNSGEVFISDVEMKSIPNEKSEILNHTTA